MTKHQIFPILLFFVLSNLSLTQTQTLSGYYDKYIMFHWKGALTSHSITIKTFPQLENLQKDSYNTFLVLYEYTDTTQTQVDQIIPVNFGEATHPVTETPIDQLNPATNYKYAYIFSTKSSIAAEDFDILFSANQMTEFSFSTFGIALQPFNFTFGAASCADTGSSSPVFNYIQAENIDFFLHLGDMHYGNIDQNDTELFYEAYYAVFNSSTQKPFYQNTPLFYIWDDHDFGPDNSAGTSPSRPAVDTVYKAIVPYGPLKAVLPEDDSQVFAAEGAPAAITDSSEYNLTYPKDDPYGIFRSFIIGRCLFIIMDLRSFKDVIYDDILGNEQKIWLENQFIFASLNDQVRMVFLVSSMFWIDNNNEGEWSAYPDTQQLISEYARKYVYSAGKDIMMISGDTHALGFDDGRNNFHGGFPVLQSAPLDSFPICAGGPYSHGIEVDRGQYSIIQVEDTGNDTVCVKLQLQKLGVTLIAYDTCNKDLYPGSAGVSCPKLIVGGEDEYGYVTFIIFGVIVVGIIGGFIAWFCLRKYRGRRGSGESEDSASVELLDVSGGRKKTT